MSTCPDSSPYASLFARAMLLLLHIRRFGVIKKVPSTYWTSSTSSLFHNTDAHYLTVQKRILDCTQYSAILQLDRRTQSHLREHAIPASLLPGLYVVPLPSLNAVNSILEDYRTQRDLLIETFLEVYPFIHAQATLSLNTLYDPNNYPPIEIVRQAFQVHTSYLTFDLPRHLQHLHPALYAHEVQQAHTRVDLMLTESRDYLRTCFRDRISALLKHLPTSPSSSTKPPRQPVITKLKDFIRHYPARTVAPDDLLMSLTQQTQALLHGITPAVLKHDLDLCTALADNLRSIHHALDPECLHNDTTSNSSLTS